MRVCGRVLQVSAISFSFARGMFCRCFFLVSLLIVFFVFSCSLNVLRVVYFDVPGIYVLFDMRALISDPLFIGGQSRDPLLLLNLRCPPPPHSACNTNATTATHHNSNAF